MSEPKDVGAIISAAMKAMIEDFRNSDALAQRIQEVVEEHLKQKTQGIIKKGASIAPLPSIHNMRINMSSKESVKSEGMVKIDACMPLSRVFRVLESKGLIEPRAKNPLSLSFGIDKSNFCEFHQQLTHHTDVCRIVRNKVRDLVISGHLEVLGEDEVNEKRTPLPSYKYGFNAPKFTQSPHSMKDVEPPAFKKESALSNVIASLPKYDGFGDPVRYCHFFEEAIHFSNLERHDIRAIFPMVLEGEALQWLVNCIKPDEEWETIKFNFIQLHPAIPD